MTTLSPSDPKSWRALCVFCGSRSGAKATYAQAAERLADLCVDRDIEVVYGGGRVGLMGSVARRVHERGGRLYGVIPDFLMRKEIAFEGAGRLSVVESMHARKWEMFEAADAFVVLPGGIGTLDEVVEMMTWRMLGRHAKPIFLVDIDGYWAPFLALLAAMAEGGFAYEGLAETVTVVPDVDAIFG